MPKKLYKITQFHGGMNTNSDARDIADNELSFATDVMVDEIGKIRMMGGTAAHDASGNPTVAIEPGYGLFHFSHDRIDGHLGEHLNEQTFSSHSKWDVTGDLLDTGGNVTYTENTNAGTLIQTADDRLEEGVANVTYALTYTITGFNTANITTFRIKGTGNEFAKAHTNLEKADGTHTTTFTSHATDADQPFTIDVVSDGSLTGELINEVNNREFEASTGVDWAVHDPDGGTGAAISIDSGTANKLQLTTTTDNAIEGAKLPIAHIDAATVDPVMAGRTYVIKMDLDVAAGTPAMIIGLGGALTESFAISTTEATYTKELTAINATGDLLIYNTSSTALVFTVDNVSVKEKRAFTYMSLKVYDPAETGDDYLVMVNNDKTFNVGGGVIDTTTTVTHTSSLLIKPGMGVSTTAPNDYVPDNAIVESITDDTHFVMTAAGTGGVSGKVLTFTKPPGAFIYSKNRNSWSQSDTIQLGITTAGIKTVFYSVDGALRMSDASFLSPSIWYGYISRMLFKNQEPSVAIEEWYTAEQRLSPPSASYFDRSYTAVSGETDTSYSADDPEWLSYYDDPRVDSQTVDIARTVIEAAFDADGPVMRVENPGYKIKVGTGGVWYGWIRVKATFKIGPYNTVTESWGPGMKEVVHDIERHSHGYEEHNTWPNWYFDSVYTATDTAAGNLSWIPGGNIANDVWRTELVFTAYNNGIGYGKFKLDPMVLYEGHATPLPALHDGGDFTNGYITGSNVVMLFDWVTAHDTDGSGWAWGNNIGDWEIGTTFVYDGNQESTITTLIDESNGTSKSMDLGRNPHADTITTTGRPGVTLIIADPMHNGAGDSDGTIFNKRITGCNIYMKDISTASTSATVGTWWLQYTADFETGKLKVINTQAEFDIAHKEDISRQSYYHWSLPVTHSKTPASAISYEDQTGYSKLVEEKVNSYKTAVVANRTTYIGNVNQGPEFNPNVYGDRMLKSSVNKFDKFPENRRVEVSVEDGDEIVKLEEYADRILQFKKHKMHIINISQDIEFLEETFMHKGVTHPAAVCKTDYGIAWINRQGVYLYDGQRVNNLFEKKGRQIIKESTFLSWLQASDVPMIGYIPKKRQLLISNDVAGTSSSDDDVYLYDMVTQSWVEGKNKLPSGGLVRYEVTNFVTDWNNDLITAHHEGAVVKWVDDLSDSTTTTALTVDIRTKDIDFGQPGQLKKVYKFYITHRGDASNIQTSYAVDGDKDTFTSAGSELPDSSIPSGKSVSDWATTAIIPTAAPIQCYSIRLKLSSAGGTPANFEINDISIVFRLKGER